MLVRSDHRCRCAPCRRCPDDGSFVAPIDAVTAVTKEVSAALRPALLRCKGGHLGRPRRVHNGSLRSPDVAALHHGPTVPLRSKPWAHGNPPDQGKSMAAVPRPPAGPSVRSWSHDSWAHTFSQMQQQFQRRFLADARKAPRKRKEHKGRWHLASSSSSLRSSKSHLVVGVADALRSPARSSLRSISQAHSPTSLARRGPHFGAGAPRRETPHSGLSRLLPRSLGSASLSACS